MTNSAVPWTRENAGRGIVLALVAIFIFATQDATSKFLVQTVSPFQTTMMRFWAFAAFAVVLAARTGSVRRVARTKHPALQVVRGILLVADIWLFVLALKTVQLPELQAITLVYPLIVTIAAVPILGERVGIFRISAVVAGFLGALVIVRPGGVPLDVGTLAAIGSGACYAFYIVLTRKVAASDTATTSMFYVGVVGLVMGTAVGVFFWQPLDVPDAIGVGYIMITGVVAHGLMIVALGMAPASVLQPFNYISLPWSIVFSLVFFGHLIDPISLLGAAVIVGAGLVVMARERIRKIPVAGEAALPGKE